MPLIFGGLTVILIQILSAVHCVRHGRNQGWLMLIIFLPLLGSLAYFVMEIMPGLGMRREVRMAKAAAVRKLDPERDLRMARDALEVADTAANRIALADRLAELERWGEAIPEYEAGLARAPRRERGIMVRLARACFEAGEPAKARQVLESLPETNSPSERDRADLLLARVLEEQSENEQALKIYADVAERLPGAEAQCRQAALLMKLGRETEARFVLEEVERRVKRLDRHERAREREMYDWAERSLAELRAEQGG
ncbi:MAG TPA: tetratricopeptide repeat protein [Allosphingosinicella sp.]|jgi:hypothetical protein